MFVQCYTKLKDGTFVNNGYINSHRISKMLENNAVLEPFNKIILFKNYDDFPEELFISKEDFKRLITAD